MAQGCGVQSEEYGHPKKSSWIERPGVRLQADRSQAGPAWLRPCYRPLLATAERVRWPGAALGRGSSCLPSLLQVSAARRDPAGAHRPGAGEF